MAAVDSFAKVLLEEAKAFLEKGRNADSLEAQGAFFHSAILLGFCSLEAHLNAIADDFASTMPELTILDQSILTERELELKDGEFALTDRAKLFRLKDRIEYLSRRFGGNAIDKRASYWTDFKHALKLRNNLSHPKTHPSIDVGTVESALNSILELLNALYREIYRVRMYPGYNRRLSTTMTL